MCLVHLRDIGEEESAVNTDRKERRIARARCQDLLLLVGTVTNLNILN
jgi:hypothetical protein